jgi:DNA adenine methylase
MIYLNQTCFNGVYRVNKKGQFNVPIGSSLDRLICDESNIRKVACVLKNVNLSCVDFSKFLEHVQKTDFIYLDPPYHPISTYSDFTRYTKEKFHAKDQIRLKEEIDKLHKKGAYVMLSNSDCDFIRKLYRNYKIYKMSSSRALNSDKHKRGRVSELLITNY